MKRLILILLGLLAFAPVLNAQQLPIYSQYSLNNFLHNPAIAGSESYMPVRLMARQQWVDISGAPQSQVISMHTPLKNEQMGLGGYLFNDNFGALGRTGAHVAYAYHLDLNGSDTKLAFGLSGSVYQFSLDREDLNLTNGTDNAIDSKDDNKIIPDASFGTYLYNGKYYAGLSINQLLNPSIDFNGNNDDAIDDQIVPQMFMTAGYMFNLSEEFDLEPSALLKLNQFSLAQADIVTRVIYKKNYWLGVSYRTSNDIVSMLGVKYDKYFLAYAFDYGFTSLSDYSSGSHEIMIGINFGEKKKDSSFLQTNN